LELGHPVRSGADGSGLAETVTEVVGRTPIIGGFLRQALDAVI
jgi:hypothetical protein